MQKSRWTHGFTALNGVRKENLAFETHRFIIINRDDQELKALASMGLEIF